MSKVRWYKFEVILKDKRQEPCLSPSFCAKSMARDLKEAGYEFEFSSPKITEKKKLEKEK